MSDEQRMLKASVDAFVSRHCPPEKAKQWDDENYFPSELWKSMSELEWFGLPFPEEWGGGGGSALDLVLMAEGLGRASLDIAMAYVGTFVPGLTLYKWGSDEQRNRFRDGFLRGE
ncbi:MAG TPA: acyl-CoA dehydrogenase family protein, partial [Chloroflexota bacterium]|nr:acyl-CoA dehydrogenase family protein [Chloroflexota bacterium]